MKTEYVLQCECGERIRLGPAQAGQTIHCRCGRSFEAPTLLAMKGLEQVESADGPSAAKTTWGARQRLLLVGLIVIAVSAGLLAYFFRGKPTPRAAIFDAETIRRYTEELTLLESYQLWEQLQRNIAEKRPVDQFYDHLLQSYRIRMGVTLVILGLGILTVIASRFVRTGAACHGPCSGPPEP